jgi:ribose transport system permease protein
LSEVTADARHRRARLIDRAPFLVACVMLAALLVAYASLREGVVTLDELNVDTAAALTLILAATGQTIVLLRGGIDLSIGGMISLGTVIAATQFGETFAGGALWTLLVLLIGFAVGAINGLLISVLRLQPFLVTLATWSILSGAALPSCRSTAARCRRPGCRSATPPSSAFRPRSGS